MEYIAIVLMIARQRCERDRQSAHGSGGKIRSDPHSFLPRMKPVPVLHEHDTCILGNIHEKHPDEQVSYIDPQLALPLWVNGLPGSQGETSGGVLIREVRRATFLRVATLGFKPRTTSLVSLFLFGVVSNYEASLLMGLRRGS